MTLHKKIKIMIAATKDHWTKVNRKKKRMRRESNPQPWAPMTCGHTTTPRMLLRVAKLRIIEFMRRDA